MENWSRNVRVFKATSEVKEKKKIEKRLSAKDKPADIAMLK